MAGRCGGVVSVQQPSNARAGACAALWPALAWTMLVWLVAATQLALGGLTVPWDSKNQFYAFYRFLAASLHAGASPFWNPYHYGGHPWIADPQSMIFWPQFLAWAYIDGRPSIEGFDLFIQAHLLAGGLAMATIGWRRGWPTPASVLTAMVFMLGGAASSRLNHTGIIVVYGLGPVAMLLLELAMERRSAATAIAFAVVASTIAIGRTQVALMLCLLLAVLAVRIVWNAHKPWCYLWSRLPILGLMAVTGTVLVTVPIILTLQLAEHSNRPEEPLSAALEASLHPASLVSMVAANVFGAQRDPPGYWGPGDLTVPEVAATDDSFNTAYFGVVPAGLLVWLGLVGARLYRKGRRLWVIVMALATLFALGRFTPLYTLFFTYLPGFSFFRRPVDGLFMTGLMVALLSGEMLADFIRHGQPRAGRAALAVVLGVIGALTVSAVAISARSNRAFDCLEAMALTLPVIGLVAVLIGRSRTARERSVAAVGLVLVAGAELLYWNVASRLNSEEIYYYRVLQNVASVREPLDREAIVMLDAELRQRHAEGYRPRVEILGLGGPWQNFAMTRAIEAIGGYNPLRIGAYDRLVMPGEASATIEDRTFPASFPDYNCPIAKALGLEYVVLDRPLEKVVGPAAARNAHALLDGPRVWIYRLEPALPRVAFHHRVLVADANALDASGAPAHQPSATRALIALSTPPSEVLQRQSATGNDAGPARGSAHIRAWRNDAVTIDVTAQTPGVVVLHDTFYPGWVAQVDGRPAPILRADLIFRAVEVAAGRHSIEFRYQPLSLANLARAIQGRDRRRTGGERKHP